MSVLLDTHAALWYALGDPLLSTNARNAIDNETGHRYVSSASFWEIAIKIGIGKYKLAMPFVEFWKGSIQKCGYSILPIELEHAARLTTIPFIHRDPFDRILVAQALCGDVDIVSNDSILDGYGIRRIW